VRGVTSANGGSTTPNGRPGPVTSTSNTGVERTETTTLNPNNPGFTLNTARGFSPSTAFLNAQGVSAVLSFLNQDADTRTLATPRAVTLDNQETRLEVTRAIPIFDSSEGIGQAGTTVSSTKPNYTNVGTILVVTPRISGSNVQMRLRPEISDTAGISDKQISGKRTQADIFTMQKIETSVIIPSGNTLVMGGLMQDSSEKGYTKVPVLGDIPILGWAFRSESQNRRKRSIVIFVTPTIIDDMDFQPYRTEFLNTKMPEHPPIVEDPMLSGKPAKHGLSRTKSQPDIGEAN
jgi:type II secretory pathway component GspD/PulD (secretin)